MEKPSHVTLELEAVQFSLPSKSLTLDETITHYLIIHRSTVQELFNPFPDLRLITHPCPASASLRIQYPDSAAM